MNPIFASATVETPAPGGAWQQFSPQQRLDAVAQAMRSLPAAQQELVIVVDARADGQIIVKLTRTLPASQRGPVLLDLEDVLKKEVDPALCVWLDPLGDRYSLRNLRGIKVKA